jgi:hypothetical protein
MKGLIMEDGQLPHAPLCSLRRDLADELGFAEFIEQHPELGSKDPAARVLNRKFGLLANSPRYVAFYTEKGSICITPDTVNVFRAPNSPLFTEAWLTAEKAARARPLMKAALNSMGRDPLEASADGRPRAVLVQDRISGEVWLWPANAKTERFLRSPR